MSRPLLAAVLVIASGPAGPADDPAPPKSYTTPVADGKFTLVMLAPDVDPKQAPADEQQLRSKYPRSGLYKTDPSGYPDLKWAVDWYSATVRPAADGVHLARVHNDPVRLPGQTRDDRLAAARKLDALSLYADGKLVQAFTVGDLFDVTAFTDDQLDGPFTWGGEAKLDDAAGTVTVRAATGEWATVDFRTREVVDRGRASTSLAEAGTRPDRQPWWAVLAAGVAVVGIGGAILFLTAAALVRPARPRRN